jgi:MOSC domain-containing protein YiiM
MSETNSSAKVLSLNVVHAVIPDVGGSVGVTSIDKRSVSDSRQVTTAGVAGDQRSDIPNHGMPEQAVYAYAREDYEWWEVELDREIPAGKFGENLTTVGIDVTNAVIGQTWRIGSTLLQVTGPRIPCGTFARFMEEDKWVKRFMDEGMPGTYFQVLEAGEITSGDEIKIESTPEHGVTVSDVYQLVAGDRDPERIARVLNCPELPEEMHTRVSGYNKHYNK